MMKSLKEHAIVATDYIRIPWIVLEDYEDEKDVLSEIRSWPDAPEWVRGKVILDGLDRYNFYIRPDRSEKNKK